jgi:hypothetical protein
LGADTQFELIRDSPPTFAIKLARQREIAPDVWAPPDGDRRALAHGQFTASALLSLRAGRNRAYNSGTLQRRISMATQIVMDRTGDTRHNFDAKNADAVSKAEERFRELTGAGFTAAVRTSSGEPVVKRTFDPNAEETLFFPRLVGG